jgi:folylpolyglutamate synthase/dihydropteroate synthase
VATVHLVTAASPRAATAEDLLQRTAHARSGSIAAPDVGSEFAELLRDPDPAPIIVAGSLYLVGEARERLLSGRFEDE